MSERQDRLRAALDPRRRTGRPVVVTQGGKPAGVLMASVLMAGVLMDIGEYKRPAEREVHRARGERRILPGSPPRWRAYTDVPAGQQPSVTGEDGNWVLAMEHAIVRSAREARFVLV